MKKIVAVLTIISFIFYCTGVEKLVEVSAKAGEARRAYLIGTKNKAEAERLQRRYDESGQINANEEGNLEENQMAALQMTEQEAQMLAENPAVSFVERDYMVEANSKTSENRQDKEIHKKKEKKIKKNTGNTEWNVRMIRAGTEKRRIRTAGSRNRIKIAVLDSGVDYGNDIELAGSVTLVPGEEEMNPLFMDGSGHGNSVAGLIAALENEEGITGINPRAEIYSIRVLDNQNRAPVSRVIEGIYMAIDQHVQILNMSFGMSEYSAALEQAVKDAEEAGILMVAAAGNGGKDGVQYPAAFEEVMAVGSVDQHGDAAPDSAEGEEMEIVAPGELVRSTGELGDECVSSGTSLAAPQVAAAASLIWERDPYATSDFVRRLLNESANGYGDPDKYGNGLLDISYALEHYDGFKQQYREMSREPEAILEENEREVLCFEETGCVEGSWSKDNHQAMVPSDHGFTKKGARYPDIDEAHKGMTLNPWWHGYWQKKSGSTRQYTVNYVASYIYISRLANMQRYAGPVQVPSGVSNTVASQIKNDIEAIKWSSEDALGEKNPSDIKRRAFIWGMAIHSLADAFAHSAYRKVDGTYYAITHSTGKYTGADDPNTVPKRYDDAKEAVLLAIKKYEGSEQSGTYAEFNPVTKGKDDYRLGNIYRYVLAVAGVSAASSFSGCNYSIPGTK